MRAYLVEREDDKEIKPVFVLARSPKDAVERVAITMSRDRFHLYLTVKSLRDGVPMDHYSVGSRRYGVSLGRELRSVVRC